MITTTTSTATYLYILSNFSSRRSNLFWLRRQICTCLVNGRGSTYIDRAQKKLVKWLVNFPTYLLYSALIKGPDPLYMAKTLLRSTLPPPPPIAHIFSSGKTYYIKKNIIFFGNLEWWILIKFRVSSTISGIDPKKVEALKTLGCPPWKKLNHKMSHPPRADPCGAGTGRVPFRGGWLNASSNTYLHIQN